MKNQRAKCPKCNKVCNSKGGMTIHMNMVHLILSPSQLNQAKAKLEGIKKDGEGK